MKNWDVEKVVAGCAAGTPQPDYNRDTYLELRANKGRITTGYLAGLPTLILTSVGAKTLRPRVRIIGYAPYGDKYLLVGSYAGGPKDPSWVNNLVVHPYAVIEVEEQVLAVKATLTHGDTRDEMFAIACKAIPTWAEYQQKSVRTLPVFVLDVVNQEL